VHILRRPAFLAVAAAVILSSVLPASLASASAATSGSWVAANRQSAQAALLSFAAAHPAGTLAAGNFIGNAWSGNLGVIHVRDGSYTHGTHDAALPPDRYTDRHFGWANTAGWYVGANYCTAQLRSDDGGPWHQQLPDLGPGQHFICSSTSYIVAAYRC
jgi:hypothetical protein